MGNEKIYEIHEDGIHSSFHIGDSLVAIEFRNLGYGWTCAYAREFEELEREYKDRVPKHGQGRSIVRS